MIAELRELLTVEQEPLDSVRPRSDAFCVSLRAIIGPSNSPGEESFDFDVCSPAWLEAELDRQAIIGGRFLLIARDFNSERIEEYVRKRISQASGSDWSTVADKIARWTQWEFEDYRP